MTPCEEHVWVELHRSPHAASSVTRINWCACCGVVEKYTAYFEPTPAVFKDVKVPTYLVDKK